jgi:ferredoxin--NADP+ reductase
VHLHFVGKTLPQVYGFPLSGLLLNKRLLPYDFGNRPFRGNDRDTNAPFYHKKIENIENPPTNNRCIRSSNIRQWFLDIQVIRQDNDTGGPFQQSKVLYKKGKKVSHKIVSKSQLSENVFTADVEAPFVARARKPGQFVIININNEYGERIPLTIADADSERETIRLIWQRVGKTTAELADLQVGDEIANVVGPLGRPTHVENFGTVVCVGGGIGIAPLLPIAKALRMAGNKIISILGARDKQLLILENEFARISDDLIVTTDDGSYGQKGLVTEPLKQVCQRSPKPDKAFVIGPAVMMKVCCEVTKQFNVPTQVSLNTIMVDGTGMCGGCRVEFDGRPKFVCVDGPEFDGHKVNFDLMIKRLNAYKNQEQSAYEQYKKHRCKIGLDK